ncbi:MAG: hypothetical protein H7X71_00900, partial [Chitinophagales bacterium]|nr:hypothetical protein [Chitinophagales bacterium]
MTVFKQISTIILFTLFISEGFAQTLEKKESPFMKNSPDFYEIQNAWYEKYDSILLEYEVFGGEFNEADDLMDKFKRWEFIMKTRVDQYGNFPDPAIVFKETEKYKLAHPEAFSNSRSATWAPFGDAVVPVNGGGSGRINCIQLDPLDPDIIYIGAAGGGVWKSPDGGTTWIPLGDQLPVTSIGDIAIDPTSTNIIYVATGDCAAYEIAWQEDQDFWGGVYSAGVLKSLDGGITWNPTGLSYNQDDLEIVQRLIIHPTSPNILLAATRNGIYRTNDGGDSWTLTEGAHCYDLALNSANPDIVYAVDEQDVLISEDAGETWSILENNLGAYGRTSIETTAADADVIYVLNEGGGFFRSEDAGVNWETQKDPRFVTSFYGYYDMQFDASDVNVERIISGGLTIVRNTTGGDNNWAEITQWSDQDEEDYVHADAHAFFYHPTNEDIVFAGCDGGIFKSTDNGNSWTDLSKGLRIAQIYRISTSATDPDRVLGGWQDNGTNLWDGTTYEEIDNSTWDGMEAIIDFTDPDIMFLAHQYGDVYRTTDGGDSWNGEICCGDWVTPYVMDPTDHNIMYYGDGSGNIWKSTDNGENWTNKNGALGGSVFAISVSPANNDYIYAASLTKIKVSVNGGDSWSNITGTIPTDGIGINYIATSNTDANKVWVALSAYSEGDKVYYSSDAGDTWTNISGTLPNVPVNTIVYENDSDDRL